MPKDKKADSEKSKKGDKEKKGKKKEKAARETVVKAVKKPATSTPQPAKKTPKPRPAAASAPAPEIVITVDDISLRAYFIAERRQAMGWPGDSTSDWVEAERQLKAEAARKAKK